MVTSFIAGFYPSLVLSAFQPIKVLYSKQKLLGKNYLTRGLIVLQFALAIFLIIGTIAINSH
jgi:putative ABC transport system permease protein